MADFGPDIATRVQEVCRTGAGEIGGAFSRAFGGTFEATAGELISLDPAKLAAEFSGPGLMCMMKVGNAAALLLCSEASGMLPDWYGKPDASGQNRLYTLGLELGMTVLPEEFMPVDFQTARLESLAEAVQRGEVATTAGLLTLSMKCGDKVTTLWLLWPASQPANVFSPPPKPAPAPVAPPPPVQKKAAAPSPASTAAPSAPSSSKPKYRDLEDGIRILPSFTRSLLKIKVPVIVTLAETQRPVSSVMEIVPGSIIHFNKSCEEMLTLEVGNQKIAVGEAVKVGEKFGLRLTSITMPDERFLAVRGKRESTKTKQ